MCLAVPGKVLSIDESNPDLKMAKVDFSGVVKEISVQWLPEVKTGDYVLTHVGMALNIVDEEDAHHQTNDLARREVVACRLVGQFVESTNEVLEDEAHFLVLDLMRM